MDGSAHVCAGLLTCRFFLNSGLNTCVGKSNYHYFLLTMVFITAMLIVHCTVQIALIIDIFLKGASENEADEWFDSGAAMVVAGIMIGFVAFDGIALSLILQLLHFHMLLRREGLTTYKYILRESQRKREQASKDEERKNQRMVAMGKANDEGNTFLALRLRYGEMCKCCDPLPPLEEEKKDDEEEHPQQSSSEKPVYKPINGETEADDENGSPSNGSPNDEGNGANGTVEFEKVMAA